MITLLALSLEVTAAKDDFYAGERIDVNVKVKNLSSEPQSLVVSLKPKLVRYDGNPVVQLPENEKQEAKLNGNGGKFNRTRIMFMAIWTDI